MSKLISYYVDKNDRLFEITKESNGTIKVELIVSENKIHIHSDELSDIEINYDILEIP